MVPIIIFYLPAGGEEREEKERREARVATGLNRLIYHVIGNRTLRHETQSGEKSISQPRLASINFETEASKPIALSSAIQREEEKEKKGREEPPSQNSQRLHTGAKPHDSHVDLKFLFTWRKKRKEGKLE